MNFCLSDLVPPLRWSDAATIPELADQPDLPGAWWRSLPLHRVLAVLGTERLAELLARIALDHWPAAAVGDVLPALYVLDPDEADEPCTAIALDRTGSWAGLLALTGRELRDQPFIQAFPVVHVLFCAVFDHFAHPERAEADRSPVSGDAGAVRAAPLASAAPEAPESDHGAHEADHRAREAHEVPRSPEASRGPEALRAEAGPVPGSGPGPGPLPEPTPNPEQASDSEPAPDSEPVAAHEPDHGPEHEPVHAAEQAAEPEPVPAAEPVPSPAPVPFSAFAPASGPAPAPASAPEPVAAHEPDHGPEHEPVRAAEQAAEPEPEPEPVAEAEAEPDSAPVPDSLPAASPAAADAGVAADDADPAGPAAEHAPSDLPDLLDAAFADLDDRSWAVAQNRVFSDDPAAVEALAKLFAVPPAAIAEVEADLRRRLAEWLASPEAAPYREHLAEVRRTLGKAAPKSRLVSAAGWHRRELSSLDVPAWQFVLATLDGYHLVDEWLVEGDIVALRHHTRDVISRAKPPLTMTKALSLVASLGIHPDVSKEWLENVPQLRILSAGQKAPQRQGGGSQAGRPKEARGPKDSKGPKEPKRAGEKAEAPAPRASAENAGREPDTPVRNGDRPPGEAGGRPAAAGQAGRSPFRPLKDVSVTRRCFRQPDGRWWLRVDITAEHLRGDECPLPSGFAAYLGMSPGAARTVDSAVGEVTLSWREGPVLSSLGPLLADVGAKEGSHLFLTLSDEGVLRARHLPAADPDDEPLARALRLVGYTAPGGTPEQAVRVIATRVGLTGPVNSPDLLSRLRERGDRDLLSLLA
ncbi:hypothetical protein [Streptosporangium pseudovulgare]|uniref:Uncharacterized protein n=1 Tax=Streptosporangium pseudovulgare TaxID=35765 RepID=A0ABQ2R9Y8_9ACTN|nr:hypothetical protein [Streptosporangium pseudovulgare]GGQ21267.1 hypothetical protein GCM10010140_59430 [Streptosporangium pseudovulgare]